MKIKIKFAAMLLSAALTASYGSMNAMAVDDSYYYYDVKKASDYVLTFCSAEAGDLKDDYKKYYKPKYNKEYALVGSECTNFASQALYYGGYKMRGTPDMRIFPKIKSTGCTYVGSSKWFYYKLENNWEVENDIYSSTWSVVDKWGPGTSNIIPDSGMFAYFTKPWATWGIDGVLNLEINTPYDSVCSYVEDVEYCEDFAKKYNLKRGDIVQMDAENDGLYEHTMFVWCTEPEVRLTYRSTDKHAESLKVICGKKNDIKFRIIYTTDHAIAKSAW